MYCSRVFLASLLLLVGEICSGDGEKRRRDEMRTGAIVCDILADRFWILSTKPPIAHGPTSPYPAMSEAYCFPVQALQQVHPSISCVYLQLGISSVQTPAPASGSA
ncbi:hypothetical protein LI328DRAFT_129199 [Trichoderma asperelloides]|nr:hypothetical protein LI328DRAFT_129199 [Trichoderma asperelloides]